MSDMGGPFSSEETQAKPIEERGAPVQILKFAVEAGDSYVPLGYRKNLFLKIALHGRTAFGQTHRPDNHKDAKMADAKTPQRMDPQEVVKWLVALRRALAPIKNADALPAVDVETLKGILR